MLGFVILRTFLSGVAVLGPTAPAGAAMPDAPAILAQAAGDIDFGDDGALWANDGECDDKRFRGPGMTGTALLDEDIGRDASDCRAAWEAGQLELFQPVTERLTLDGTDFGDDSGDWANDNQCDDPRFSGEGMSGVLTDNNRFGDATDCAAAWTAGSIRLRDDADATDTADAGTPDTAQGGITTPVTEDGVDFGSDSGMWTQDGECDDPRFQGEGMAGPPLLDADIRADASDCLAAWRRGSITLIGAGDAPDSGGAPSIRNRPGDRGGR